MDAALSHFVDLVKTSLSTHLSDGGGALAVVLLLVGFLQLFLKLYKEAVSERVKEWLKTAHNLLLVTGWLVGVVFLFGNDRLWAAGIFTLAAAGYAVVKARYPALISRKGFLAGASLSALFLVGIAYYVDVELEHRRYESYDVAFLLPPDDMPKEPERLFTNLKKTLSVSFRGIGRVRIVPEKLTQEDLGKYAFAQVKNLLAYRTAEGYPRVFIRSRYGDEGGSKMLLVPYQRRAGGDAIDILWEWRSPPFGIGPDRMDEALRNGFELIVFLASKQLIKVPQEAQETIWKNILDEYSQFLALYAPACEVREQLDKLRASAQALTAPRVRELLNARCKEPAPGPDPAVAVSDKIYNTVVTPYLSGFID